MYLFSNKVCIHIIEMFLRVTQVHINILWLKNNLFCKKFLEIPQEMPRPQNEIDTFVVRISFV